MLKFKDIVRYICAAVIHLYKYIKNVLNMDTVYDCARPFMLVAGIFGIGGSRMCEIDGVRSVRNTRFSLVIAALITLFITPAFLIDSFNDLFSGEQRPLEISTIIIITFGRYAFTVGSIAVTCIQTHIYCQNLTKVLHILNNTDMMLKQENIHVNYWKIIFKTILFGPILCSSIDLHILIRTVLFPGTSAYSGIFIIVRLLIVSASEINFMWIILFLLIIRERFVGLNKLLLQNAQLASIMQDDSLLRRISLARNIHEQLSEAIALFSDSSRFLIIAGLVPGILQSLFNAIGVAMHWNRIELREQEHNVSLVQLLLYSYVVISPIMKTVVLTTVCETHKNNRRVLTARLRHLIAREEDPRIVHQLKEYIWFNHETVAGLVDLQFVDVDFTLLFTVIDIIVNYMFVIWSHYRPSVQGETM